MAEFEMFDGDEDLSDATNAFFNSFLAKDDSQGLSEKEVEVEKPRKAPKVEQEEYEAEEVEPDEEDEVEAEDEETPSEDDEGSEEGDEDSEEDTRTYADDEHVIRVKVGEDEDVVSVRDLKRLYGQEAAITKRSQEVATQRVAVEKKEAEHLAASNVLLNAARQRYAPYAKLNFLELARDERISRQEFDNLRQEAQHRYEELQFLEHSTGQYMENIQKAQQERLLADAKSSVQQLTDVASPYHIEGWNQQVYDGVRQFALDKGVPLEMVNQIIHPSVVKLIHNAMLFDKGKQALVRTEKVGKTVKKVVKTTRAPESTGTRSKANSKGAMQRLQRSGTEADAANAFLANFAKYGDID